MKYNKLSIISFVLVIVGFLISSIMPIGALLALVGFVLAGVSYSQIRKTKEKGKGFLIALLVFLVLVILSMVLLYLPIF